MSELEREEELLEDELAAGRITTEQYGKEMRALHRSARAELEAEAQEAYDNVMERGL